MAPDLDKLKEEILQCQMPLNFKKPVHISSILWSLTLSMINRDPENRPSLMDIFSIDLIRQRAKKLSLEIPIVIDQKQKALSKTQ